MTRRTPRRGFTLVEGLVVFALASIMIVLALELRGSVARQAAQTEQGADLVREALILQERLTADLEESLALHVLPEEDRPRDEARTTLVLPIYAAYRGNEVPALKYQKRLYVWDAEKKQLTRDGEVVLRQGIRDLRFRWTSTRPTILEVELVGEKGNRAKGADTTLRLPAPQGTDGLPIWVFARQHRSAEPTSSPAPTPTQL